MHLFLDSLFCSFDLCEYPSSNTTWSCYCSYIIRLKKTIPLTFPFKIVLAILVPLPFNINFRIILFICTKYFSGILIGIANMYKSLRQSGETWHLYYVESSNLWTRDVSPFILDLLYFISVMQFSAYKFYICFVTFTSKYLIFKAIVTGIVFLISLSTCSLLVYSNKLFLYVYLISCKFAKHL